MRSRELIAADESTVVAKPLLNPIVVENSQGNGRLADPASTDESDWVKVLNEIDCLLDQLVASKQGPWGQRRGLSGYATFRYKMTGSSLA